VVSNETDLVQRLRAGDEDAFATLISRYQRPMVRLAATFVSNTAVAEEVVQDTWIGVVRGIDRFEGRSSLQTWLFKILVNRARSTGRRESRHLLAGEGVAVDGSRFDEKGAWREPPRSFTDEVEDRVIAERSQEAICASLAQLPAVQREVVALRDIDGLSGPEVCEVLGISAANQRILLHRGRSRLRAALEIAIGVAP
jgi:RNA polymerase sigma-70 factor (ECF subfamily)